MVVLNSIFTMATLIILFASLLVSANGFDFSHHKHRHSRSHPQDFNLDRLLNRLDTFTSPPRVPETTSDPPKKDILSELDDPVTESNSEPDNSLFDDDLSIDSSTESPLSMKRWDAILKRKKVNSDKQSEDVEDNEDDEEEENAEDDLGYGDQLEQADSYRPWNPRGGETHSAWKWNNMGSPDSVNRMFEVYRSGRLTHDPASRDNAAEVYRHSKEIAKETQCRWPRPKVIRVADVYGSASKLYIPSCTLLYQCGDDTGCCSGSGQRCEPKTTHRIERSFFTTYIIASNNKQRPGGGIEKLPFYNHTECECRDVKEDVMPRDDNPRPESRIERNSDQGCKCPSEYTVRRLSNGSCSCDCFDRQRDCIKYKRGKEYFNHSDRLCIEMGTCRQPLCDFGAYVRTSGRCPRKHEKLRSRSRHSR